MRIQFEIKEKLPDIVTEILCSDKWLSLVLEEKEHFKRISIKDPYFESEALVEIWKYEVHIKTAWSNFTYRIYQQGGTVWCEYTGAYRGLLEQKLLPRLTPKENFLNAEVSNSVLLDKGKETLFKYSTESRKLKSPALGDERKKKEADFVPKKHPQVVYDEFIKVGVPLPPPLEE
ncbi:hypothetical protein D0T51_00545 [Parabacteroides sp. 52]|uniref:hypothetical protein n=1 Tax=unclassified Parabacteroides TaxID=2649774 RepID=UPI0013D62913|nr:MULTISPECIES: hypothetical protein [unclassified Parabacteroides]MDH6533470.1 hypothetical protein [Parabacteroides sp. PM5-20]NDV54226.1 hypothetical protein [Parabacteroides sp. 52]